MIFAIMFSSKYPEEMLTSNDPNDPIWSQFLAMYNHKILYLHCCCYCETVVGDFLCYNVYILAELYQKIVNFNRY